jgi:hypothetical protein
MKFNAMSKPRCSPGRLRSLLITSMILFLFSGIAAAQSLTMDPKLGQSVFSTPELAAQALVKAIADHDKDALDKILGAEHDRLLPMDEIDSADREGFLAAWSAAHTLIPEGDQQRVLAVGEKNWTLPIPMVEGSSGWYFDVEAGIERIRIRRIGRNELSAMQAVLAYYDAQMEYAEQDRDNSGGLEYAQKFISSAGQHDGLYWDIAAGEEPSPLGPLFAEADQDSPYHGYRYRILTSQGEHAQDGVYGYLLNGRMIAGFALIAWPAEYGDSGVMSFKVSHKGIIYEQDLGPDSAALASTMPNFDPAPGWKPAQEVNAPQMNANNK